MESESEETELDSVNGDDMSNNEVFLGEKQFGHGKSFSIFNYFSFWRHIQPFSKRLLYGSDLYVICTIYCHSR